MEYRFLEILSGTPWGVWVLFIYLLVVGKHATKKRNSAPSRLMIMPIIFVVWSLYSLSAQYPLGIRNYLLWLAALLVGILCSLYLLPKEKIAIDQTKSSILMHGSYIPLVIGIVFFMMQYAIGVTHALYPALKTDPWYLCAHIFASGLIVGIMWARVVLIMREYLAAKG